jgi:hypothetical protein
MDGDVMAEGGYSRSPWLLKGALVHFSAPLLVPVPNVIVFQYNPETLRRELKPWAPPPPAPAAPAPAASEQGEQQAQGRTQPYDPEEEFTVTLELDATDALERPELHPVAFATGVASQIAALETLMYPESETVIGGLLSGSLSVSIGAGGISITGATAEVVPAPVVPVVLLIWGPGRIVPVRIINFSVEEQAFSPLLYPIRAKASVGMRVLTPAAFAGQEETGTIKLAKAAYTFTRAQRETLATANLLNSAESILGMLPL